MANVEALYFEKTYEKGQKLNRNEELNICPKTLEYETFTSDHATSIIHGVAVWLEKIYEQNEKLSIQEINRDNEARREEFDESAPNEGSVNNL